MVGKRPRNYTDVSRTKLALVIYQRYLARNPDADPAVVARIVNQMVDKHAHKHGLASRIYHAIKPYVETELGITGQDLMKARSLTQKVVMDILRKYESKNAPLEPHELAPIVLDALSMATVKLRLTDEQARRIINMILNHMTSYVTVATIEEVERAVGGGGVAGGE